jgi:DNA-binding response OmpR family regulator
MSPPIKKRTDALRIIVTDDDPTKLLSITQTLREAGHCVFAAYDGQSALELVAALPGVDLLVTNTRLGSVDGPVLMRGARELHPSMPILHVVQRGSPDDDGRPPDVLTLREPFTPEQLLAAVGGLVGSATRSARFS